jgi:hypothetical protein
LASSSKRIVYLTIGISVKASIAIIFVLFFSILESYSQEHGGSLRKKVADIVEDLSKGEMIQIGSPECLSPLNDWTKIVNQFSHSKFRNHVKAKKTIQSGGKVQYSSGV